MESSALSENVFGDKNSTKPASFREGTDYGKQLRQKRTFEGNHLTAIWDCGNWAYRINSIHRPSVLAVTEVEFSFLNNNVSKVEQTASITAADYIIHHEEVYDKVMFPRPDMITTSALI